MIIESFAHGSNNFQLRSSWFLRKPEKHLKHLNRVLEIQNTKLESTETVAVIDDGTYGSAPWARHHFNWSKWRYRTPEKLLLKDEERIQIVRTVLPYQQKNYFYTHKSEKRCRLAYITFSSRGERLIRFHLGAGPHPNNRRDHTLARVLTNAGTTP